ncbi:DUF4126 domain-containing protein [Chitinibacteraceae bacterium HSL-7]
MSWMIGLAAGVALAAASGLRVFLPLLGLACAAQLGLITLRPELVWLATPEALIALAIAALLEVGAYFIPWLDHALDVALAPLAAAAGTLMMGASLPDLPPIVGWTVALLAGGGLSTLVHAGSSGVRAAVSLPTAGLANPLVALGEGIGAVALTVLALTVPLLALVVAVWLVWRVSRKTLKRLRK